MPLDNSIITEIPPLTTLFTTPGKRFSAVYLAPPTWGQTSNYLAFSNDQDDPRALRYIKEQDLGTTCIFDQRRVTLPKDCISINIYEITKGTLITNYMYGDVIPHMEGANIEVQTALNNGIDLYTMGGNPYVKRECGVAQISNKTDLVLHPDTREIIWTPQKGIISKPKGRHIHK